MGSEDLFSKRKARKQQDIARRKRNLPQIPRFLIVCEGEKTEPNYFSELRDKLGIRHQSACIGKNQGSSPDKVVAAALALYDEDASRGDTFDKVFCVFDRDTHEKFFDAIQRIKDLSSSDVQRPFVAITSNPCFEVWLLLHFGYSDKPFSAGGGKSVGERVVVELKKRTGFASYEKGARGIYSVLSDRTEDAIKFAKQLRTSAAKTGQCNPWTNVDELVRELFDLAKAYRLQRC